MKLFKRGRRVRYRHRHLIVRTALMIGIPIALILGIVMFKKFITLPFMPYSLDSGAWFIYVKELPFLKFGSFFLLSFLITAGILIGLRYLFSYRYYHMRNKQLLARFIIRQGFYRMGTVQKTKGSWFDLSNSSSTKTTTKEVVTYFPKVYYTVEDGYMTFRFPTDGNEFQERFLNLARSLEVTFFSDLESEFREKGYMGYRFIENILADRLTIEELDSKNGELALMKRVIWNFDKLPHLLVTGGTGAGKTYFILAVLKGLLNGTCTKEDVYIADPKNTDLADLEGIFPNVYSQKNGIAMVVNRFKADMMKRSTEMKEMSNYRMGSNYRSLGLSPKFLIFDEFVAYMEMLSDFKEREKVLSNVKQIVMLGRQVGFFMIVGMQRPDAKYLADGIRDQFHFRIALGKNSDVGYSMMFSEADKKFTYKTKKGFGYVDSGKGVISEFYSPFISKDFDFMEEFKKNC